eukprot:jgi/Phyca11/506393/fgenesh2_kg.PHYCAscaffold_19_\
MNTETTMQTTQTTISNKKEIITARTSKMDMKGITTNKVNRRGPISTATIQTILTLKDKSIATTQTTLALKDKTTAIILLM